MTAKRYVHRLEVFNDTAGRWFYRINRVNDGTEVAASPDNGFADAYNAVNRGNAALVMAEGGALNHAE